MTPGETNLDALLARLSRLGPAELKQVQAHLARQQQDARPARELPPVNSDFYDLASTLTERQRRVQEKVRAFMHAEVAPIANEYWARGEFPRQLIGKFRKLGLGRDLWREDGTRDPEDVLAGFLASMEMARVDPSVATFFGVHNGLASLSILLCGSEAQRREWMPRMRDLDVIGAFALTEPLVGSGTAGGLTTTARREGDTWVLNGEKKWIGNATLADVVVVWARDVADNQVKGFLVRTENPGYHVEKIEGKVALRIVENGHITLTGCRVPETDRLQNANSFKDTANVLRATRAGVAWMALGCAMGAYELTLKYSQERQQFGRPIAKFQLVQNHIVKMLGNITAVQTMVMRLAQLQAEGRLRDE
ncbi:acyl-CoA dehydrogenase [Deinococcus carri]|uniref:Acyl-CoA dehydrogenase n=1 Tax=Deinococcus carri TaxID=1211323 RepID=A0ABP9W998_9DEIO